MNNLQIEMEKLQDFVLVTANEVITIDHGYKVRHQHLDLLAEIKKIENTASERKKWYNEIVAGCNKYWTQVYGDNLIDSFEKEWTQWSVDDTIKWFDLVLKIESYNGVESDDSCCDAESSNSNSDCDGIVINDSNENKECDHDEKMCKSDQNINTISVHGIDFQDIKSRLEASGFRAKKDLPFFIQPFNFKQCGFQNKKDCKILCKQTKILIEKYPKKKKYKKKSKNKIRKSDVKHKNVNDDLEGVVQDTGN